MESHPVNKIISIQTIATAMTLSAGALLHSKIQISDLDSQSYKYLVRKICTNLMFKNFNRKYIILCFLYM